MIIAGNWKMNKTCSEAVDFVNELATLIEDRKDVETLVCPPFTALFAVQHATDRAGIGLGAQDVFWKKSGAYTGQVSPGMLIDVGVKYAIIGHSEARGRFGVPEPDFDETILRHFGDN